MPMAMARTDDDGATPAAAGGGDGGGGEGSSSEPAAPQSSSTPMHQSTSAAAATAGAVPPPGSVADSQADKDKDNKDDAAAAVDGDHEPIDEEMLEEYKEMLEELGSFPDKVAINSLSMVAEDYSTSKPSSYALYRCVRSLLLDGTVEPPRKLVLVYVIDSLLKNVKGCFVPIIEADAKHWMGEVYDELDETGKTKLRKVWNTWKEFNVFSDVTNLNEAGKCFLDADDKEANAKVVAEAKAKAIGIKRATDGTLQLPAPLRKQMQMLLDEAQSTGVDELDKVSLERLADINPDLLLEIKREAQNMLDDGTAHHGSRGRGMSGGSDNDLSGSMHGSDGGGRGRTRSSSDIGGFPFADARPPPVVSRAAEWSKLDLDHLERSHDLIASLHRHVRAGCRGGGMPDVSDDPAADPAASGSGGPEPVDLLAAASAAATHLTDMLQALRAQDENKENDAKASSVGAQQARMRYAAVDAAKFTSEGLKEKNDNVVARLYDAGLPFVSSADGRRFGTQIELSRHLDELFRRGQVEKTMERTEERGWYSIEDAWTGKVVAPAVGEGIEGEPSAAAGEEEEEPDAAATSVPADESRDRCVICGINFDMFFDQDEGEWKYSNCREIDVLNDDAAEKESEAMLVHVSCLRGLGSPACLTMDQVLQSH